MNSLLSREWKTLLAISFFLSLSLLILTTQIWTLQRITSCHLYYVLIATFLFFGFLVFLNRKHIVTLFAGVERKYLVALSFVALVSFLLCICILNCRGRLQQG